MFNSGIRADLQFHPFNYGKYQLCDILKAMEERGIDILACLEYSWQKNVSLDVIRKIDKSVEDNYIVDPKENVLLFISKENGKVFCIILGQEVAPPDQRWHFLSVGALGIRHWERPEDIMQEIVDKGGLLIFDHLFADPQNWFGDISEKKEEEAFYLCKKYKDKIILEWNGYSVYWVRKMMSFYDNHDTNGKVEWLGNKMTIPVVPTTDTHAVDKKSLDAIGTCYIEMPKEEINYNNVIQSLRRNIFSFNFAPEKKYVSFSHFFHSFAVPYIKERIRIKRKEREKK